MHCEIDNHLGAHNVSCHIGKCVDFSLTAHIAKWQDMNSNQKPNKHWMSQPVDQPVALIVWTNVQYVGCAEARCIAYNLLRFFRITEREKLGTKMTCWLYRLYHTYIYMCVRVWVPVHRIHFHMFIYYTSQKGPFNVMTKDTNSKCSDNRIVNIFFFVITNNLLWYRAKEWKRAGMLAQILLHHSFGIQHSTYELYEFIRHAYRHATICSREDFISHWKIV